jgi:hypothetical protein
MREDGELRETLKLRNGIRVTCFPCVAKGPRGWTIVSAVLDEIAFYRLKGSADSEVCHEYQTSPVRRGVR